jgi:hypothetical protein
VGRGELEHVVRLRGRDGPQAELLQELADQAEDLRFVVDDQGKRSVGERGHRMASPAGYRSSQTS